MKNRVNIFAGIEDIPPEHALFNIVALWDVLANEHKPLELLMHIKTRKTVHGQPIIRHRLTLRRMFQSVFMLVPFKKTLPAQYSRHGAAFHPSKHCAPINKNRLYPYKLDVDFRAANNLEGYGGFKKCDVVDRQRNYGSA